MIGHPQRIYAPQILAYKEMNRFMFTFIFPGYLNFDLDACARNHWGAQIVSRAEPRFQESRWRKETRRSSNRGGGKQHTVYCSVIFFRALLWHPHCDLSIWLSLLAILNTLFWVSANFFQVKMDKTWKYLRAAIFLWYKNGCQWLLGMQSIKWHWGRFFYWSEPTGRMVTISLKMSPIVFSPQNPSTLPVFTS